MPPISSSSSLLMDEVNMSPYSSVGLLLVRTCGETTCPEEQYCSDLICHPCKDVCTNSSHNFDHNVCESRCQDFIHDKIKHYLTEADSLKATKDLQETIEWLRKLVAASLVISAVVALLVVSLLGFLWLRCRGKRRNKRNAEMDLMDQKINTVSGLVNNNSTKDKPLRLEMPPPSTGNSSTAAPSVITATTPVSTRHPIEIDTLEYAAYVNQGMTPSPILPPNSVVTTPGSGNQSAIGNGGIIGGGGINPSTGLTTSGETTF